MPEHSKPHGEPSTAQANQRKNWRDKGTPGYKGQHRAEDKKPDDQKRTDKR